MTIKLLARCRIGHTRLTHAYLLQREEQPECVFCIEPLTVKHLFLDCVDLAFVRQQYFTAATMNQLFNAGHYLISEGDWPLLKILICRRFVLRKHLQTR